MISFGKVKKYCKDDISLIENFEKAIADDNIWDCHHRREITTSKKELLEIGEYYNRTAEELIFLTKAEHRALHHKGKKVSDDTKLKISEAHKGNKNWLGKHHSEETKKKLSESLKGKNKGKKYRLGKHLSDETKHKMSESLKGKKVSDETKLKISESRKLGHWYNNGIKNVFVKECPEGFVRGIIKK